MFDEDVSNRSTFRKQTFLLTLCCRERVRVVSDGVFLFLSAAHGQNCLFQNKATITMIYIVLILKARINSRHCLGKSENCNWFVLHKPRSGRDSGCLMATCPSFLKETMCLISSWLWLTTTNTPGRLKSVQEILKPPGFTVQQSPARCLPSFPVFAVC